MAPLEGPGSGGDLRDVDSSAQPPGPDAPENETTDSEEVASAARGDDRYLKEGPFRDSRSIGYVSISTNQHGTWHFTRAFVAEHSRLKVQSPDPEAKVTVWSVAGRKNQKTAKDPINVFPLDRQEFPADIEDVEGIAATLERIAQECADLNSQGVPLEDIERHLTPGAHFTEGPFRDSGAIGHNRVARSQTGGPSVGFSATYVRPGVQHPGPVVEMAIYEVEERGYLKTDIRPVEEFPLRFELDGDAIPGDDDSIAAELERIVNECAAQYEQGATLEAISRTFNSEVYPEE